MSELLVWLDYYFGFGFFVRGYSSIVSRAHSRKVRGIGFYVQALMVLAALPCSVWIARCTPFDRGVVWLRLQFPCSASSYLHAVLMQPIPIRSLYALDDVMFMAVEVG